MLYVLQFAQGNFLAESANLSCKYSPSIALEYQPILDSTLLHSSFHIRIPSQLAALAEASTEDMPSFVTSVELGAIPQRGFGAKPAFALCNRH
eukprot:IDg20980t1